MSDKTTTITRPCIGCAAPLDYQLTIWSDASAPEVLPPMGAVAYKAGHLCAACQRTVDSALAAARTEARPPFVFLYGYGGEGADFANERRVESIDDARKLWLAFIERTGWAVSVAGNGGIVRDATGKTVARISYNGRVWMPDEAERIGR